MIAGGRGRLRIGVAAGVAAGSSGEPSNGHQGAGDAEVLSRQVALNGS